MGEALNTVESTILHIEHLANRTLHTAEDAVDAVAATDFPQTQWVQTGESNIEIFTPTVGSVPTAPSVSSAPAVLSTSSAPTGLTASVPPAELPIPLTTVSPPTAPALPGADVLPPPSVGLVAPGFPGGSPSSSLVPSFLSVSGVSTPAKPSLSMPVAPVLGTVTIPDSPVIIFPSLDIEIPEYSISAPTSFAFNVGNILINDDPLVVAAKAKLLSNIEGGGTGLSEAVENDIWARDLERTEQQIEDSTDKVTSMWAKKGFSLPDGLLAHSLSEVQTEHYNRQIDRSREIAINQATLEQTNIFKSIELGVGLVTSLVDMLIRYEGITLQAQESTAKFANEYITLQIQTYGIKVEGYKAAVVVYESKVKTNLAMVEVYKSQIDGELAKAQVNEQNVKVYTEQYNAVALQVQAYRTEIDAMVAELQFEKSKVETNKLQFDIWAKKTDVDLAVYNKEVEVSKVQSAVDIATQNAELEEYKAQAAIDLATYNGKLEAYKAQVAVDLAIYNAFIEAKKTGSAIDIATYEGQVEAYKTQANVNIETHKAELEAYKAEFNANIATHNAELEAYKAQSAAEIATYNGKVEAYRAQSSIGVATTELMSRQAETQMRGNLLATELELKGFEVNNNSIQNKAALLLEAQKAIMSATASMASGAMAAQSASASVGYTESTTLEES